METGSSQSPFAATVGLFSMIPSQIRSGRLHERTGASGAAQTLCQTPLTPSETSLPVSRQRDWLQKSRRFPAGSSHSPASKQRISRPGWATRSTTGHSPESCGAQRATIRKFSGPSPSPPPYQTAKRFPPGVASTPGIP